MLKAADAFAAAGYDVTVVATRHEPWATDADVDVRSRRTWPVRVVDYRRHERRRDLLADRRRASRRACGRRTPSARRGRRCRSSRARSAACTRRWCARSPRCRRISSTAARPARWRRSPKPARRTRYAVRAGPRGLSQRRDERAGSARSSMRWPRGSKRTCFGDAAFLTTSSEAIADAYRERYGVRPSVVHNTFPLPAQTPDLHARRSRCAPRLLVQPDDRRRDAGWTRRSRRSAAIRRPRRARAAGPAATMATSTR